MHPANLETLVDRELKQLPLPHAPRTLLPRVMAAVGAGSLRPWYTRAWLTWPLGWQAASAAALILLLVSSALLMPSARTAAAKAADLAVSRVAPSLQVAPGVMRAATSLVQQAELAVQAARVIWRALVEPLVVYAFGVVMLMCLACAAFGTALNRVALS